MNLPPKKVCQKIKKLHGLLGSPNDKEGESARVKLNELLAEYGATWNDVLDIIAAADATGGNTVTSAGGGASAGACASRGINVLDLVMVLIEEHVSVTPAECLAAALWLLHTYVFNRFAITPRLAILSPVRGCGKTTLLELLELLCGEPFRVDDVSAAAIYHELARRPGTTLLVDEVDNLGLLSNRVLRSILNSGHRLGGGVGRFVGGWSRRFSTFAPLAVAAIGATETLPLPLLHRSVTINMQRFAPSEHRARLKRLNKFDPAFAAARDEIRKWAATCQLACDPEMPPSLYNRAADNWRVLVTIADDLGHGETARSVAVELCANRTDEDAVVTLLDNIRTIFLARGVDRISSVALVEALVALDDGGWGEWRGPTGDRLPHWLTQFEVAAMLRNFQIKPKTIWPLHRRPGDKSARGYLRSEFEAAWRAYCPVADTPTQPSKIIPLPRS